MIILLTNTKINSINTIPKSHFKKILKLKQSLCETLNTSPHITTFKFYRNIKKKTTISNRKRSLGVPARVKSYFQLPNERHRSDDYAFFSFCFWYYLSYRDFFRRFYQTGRFRSDTLV